jgi:2-polyprenyl-3-methyl-5-hydroxy-6-metoxy-1,4-benzoquinol methylase
MQIVQFGNHWSFNLLNDPKRLSFVLCRYIYAAELAGPRTSVLELGCSEGIGAHVLRGSSGTYFGVDMDKNAIETAHASFPDKQFTFTHADFLENKYGAFDLVVSLDVIEHLDFSIEEKFWSTIRLNLATDGVGVIGTPNLTSQPYASAASKAGHINCFTYERLRETMAKHFRNVFMFGINDEVLHAGYGPMCHYLLALGMGKK